jgi:hypothetical protein
MMRLTRGMSISKESAPEKPAFEKILQKGTIRIAPMTSMIISSNRLTPATNASTIASFLFSFE